MSGIAVLGNTKRLSDTVRNLNIAHNTTEQLVAGSPSVNGNIHKRVDALASRGVKVASHLEAVGVVGRVEEVSAVPGLVLGGGDALVLLVDGKVLPLVGEASIAVGNGVPGVPGNGESNTLGTSEGALVVGVDASGDNIGRETGPLVHADGVALLPVLLLLPEVLGVCGTKDVESVSVVGSDDNEGLLELADLLEVLEGGTDGVVEFEQVTEGTVDVLDVHLLVDEGGLGHQGPSGSTLLGTGGEDVNGLESHVLESGLVEGSLGSVGLDGMDEGVGVDVLVEPGGDVSTGKDGKGTVLVVEGVELGLVVTDLVALLGPPGELVDVSVLRGSDKVLGTTTEENVNATPGVPGVVGGASEVLLNDGSVSTTLGGVGADCGGGCVGNVCLGNGTDLATSGTAEHLKDSLDTGIVVRLAG